jgi:type IV secretion system protein VirB4
METELSFGHSILPTLVGAAGSATFAAALVAFCFPKIFRRIFPEPRERQLSDFLPFDSVAPDGRTVRMRDGAPARLYALGNADSSLPDIRSPVEIAAPIRELIEQLAETGAILRFFTTRRKPEPAEFQRHQSGTAEQALRSLDDETAEARLSESVLLLSFPPTKKKIAEERFSLAERLLAPLGARAIGSIDDDPDAPTETVGAFLGRLVAPIARPTPGLRSKDDPEIRTPNLADALAKDKIRFLEDGDILFRRGTGNDERSIRCAVLGVKRLGGDVSPLSDGMLGREDHDAVILVTVEPLGRVETLAHAKERAAVAASSLSRSVAYGGAAEATETKLGTARLCLVTETLILMAETDEALELAEHRTRLILGDRGLAAFKEKGASQTAWFGQFPSHDVRPRALRTLSPNAAALCLPATVPAGLPFSDFGKGPLLRLRSVGNAPYDLQLHADSSELAPGHVLCIAPEGSEDGRLRRLVALAASRRPDVRLHFLDVGRGSYVLVTALGGRHVTLADLGADAGKETLPKTVRSGIDPLSMDGDRENVEFLKNWLVGISGLGDHEALERIDAAVEAAFAGGNDGERSLARLYEKGLAGDPRLAREFFRWVDPGQNGGFLRSKQDPADLSDGCQIVAFDLSAHASDASLAAATMQYLIHRIRRTLAAERRPGIILVEDSSHLFLDQRARQMHLVALRDLRRFGGCVIDTLRGSDALKRSGLSAGNALASYASQWIFPDRGAKGDAYDALDLSEKEKAFVLGLSRPIRRFGRDHEPEELDAVLVRRPGRESVLLDLSCLRALGDGNALLSDEPDDIARAAELQRRHRTDWPRRYVSGETP